MIRELYKPIEEKIEQNKKSYKPRSSIKRFRGIDIDHVPKKTSRTSSLREIQDYFNTNNVELAKHYKKNFKFYNESFTGFNSDRFSVLVDFLNTIDPESVPTTRIKSILDYRKLVTDLTGLNVPLCAYVILDESVRTNGGRNKQNILREFKKLFHGYSIKDFLKATITNMLTKKQLKIAINSSATKLKDLVLETVFAHDAPNWRKLKNSSVHHSCDTTVPRLNHAIIIKKLLIDNININQIDEVYDFISYMNNEETNELTRIGSKRIVQESKIWHDQMQFVKVKKNVFWETKGYTAHDFKVVEEKDESITSYSFIEVDSSKDLAREGKVMKHCVYSYVRTCVTGSSSIISIRSTNSSQVGIKFHGTIEIRNGIVVQFKGKLNRMPDSKIMKLAKEYFRSKEVGYDSYRLA